MFTKCIPVFTVLTLLILSGCGESPKKVSTADLVTADDDDAAKKDAGKSDAPKKETKPAAAGGATEAYDASKATGVIKGVVVLEGAAPRMGKISVPDDTCKNHRDSGGQSTLEHEEVVSKDGKLANVIVYISKGYEKYNFENVKLPNEMIDQHGCQYAPHVLAVMTGQKLDIKSSDPLAHNIHIKYAGNEKNIAMSGPGISPSHPSFDEGRMGVVVQCDVHAWMRAYMSVLEHPFFAVTKEDGKFEIKLPPGKYELSTWQEECDEEGNKKRIEGPAPQQVEVTDKPAELTLTYKVK